MDQTAQPFRSVLYVPASNARALAKLRDLAVDAVILDLEDAVAPDMKIAARAALATDHGARFLIVRINALDSEWGRDDAVAVTRADAVLLPKVNRVADIEALAELVGDLPIWAMMETPLGILNAAKIAEHPKVTGLVMGTNDLAKELNCSEAVDRIGLMSSLQICILAAKAHGCVVIDGVYNAFQDGDGLMAQCQQGRDLGFDGKSLIHPAQLAAANQVFAPSSDEVEQALRQIAAFEIAKAAGQGVAVLDGKLIESLHIETARQTLKKAEIITKLET